MRVFLCAPNIEFDATGESYIAWRWAEALSHEVELTVFGLQRPNRKPLQETLPRARALTAPMPRFFSRWRRFEAMLKPHYPFYMRAARRTLRAVREEIDIAHQIMPNAARYPIPLMNMGLPYVVGPVGGALETPEAFRKEARSAAWYTRARAIDQWRFRRDPWLRASYSSASLVLGVAPYMKEVLKDIPLQRFACMLELGAGDLPEMPDRESGTQNVRLLHVGRGVRTKGLRDVVRALGQLKDRFPGMTLTSAGTGEEIEICKKEAERLGVSDRVRFLGLIPREQVDALFAEADIFTFPSFREPAGIVLYEAMGWGLPVIAAARGGPDWIVDDQTGLRVAVTEPEQYATDIASAIQTLAGQPELRRKMGRAGRAKVERDGLWPQKARQMVHLYSDVLADVRA